jgi:hypothetical protein
MRTDERNKNEKKTESLRKEIKIKKSILSNLLVIKIGKESIQVPATVPLNQVPVKTTQVRAVVRLPVMIVMLRKKLRDIDLVQLFK